MPATDWYFAYGSNMQNATFLQRRRMQPLEVTTGRLDGYRLVFDLPTGPGQRGAANLVEDRDANVWGVLYRLHAGDFERLDRSEGVPRLYAKVAVTIAATLGLVAQAALTYVSEYRSPERKPSVRYMGLLLEGARQHGLPTHYHTYLRSFEYAWDERDGARNVVPVQPTDANKSN